MQRANHDRRSSYALSLAILGGLYFVFGFVTWLNGPLIGFVRLAFDLDSDGKAFLVTTAFYLSYFCLALPASWILERTGMKNGMALGLAIMAAGSLGFGSYVALRSYPGALAALFVIGSGLALLQTAVNPYVSIIGPLESAARRISVMGICNKAAGIVSPVLIGSTAMAGIDALERDLHNTSGAARTALLDAFAGKMQLPYVAMAALLALFALGILRSRLPDLSGAQANPAAGARDDGRSLFSFPHLWLGVVALFLFVGVEVLAADAIGTYGKGFALPSGQTKYFTALTMTGMLIGYLGGIALVPRRLSQEQGLAISAVLGLLFSAAAWATDGYVSVGFVAALGFANAIMWPAIFPLAIAGLGRHTERGSALLIMGIVGGAIVPRLYAELKDRYDFQAMFFAVSAPCYLYILFYGLAGYRVGRSGRSHSAMKQPLPSAPLK